MSIKSWPKQERPREKLLSQGSHSLSNAELLAISLRTGCKGKTAIDLARDLLIRFGTLRGLLHASEKEFCKKTGLGSAKYVQLQASLEICRRYLAENIDQSSGLNGADNIKNFLISKLSGYEQEVFACMLFDNKHRLICFKELFHGSINSSVVYPREVVKLSLTVNAAAIILAHNHPSGDVNPSANDIQITKVLREILYVINVEVLDHIIVGHNHTFSFAEQKVLDLL